MKNMYQFFKEIKNKPFEERINIINKMEFTYKQIKSVNEIILRKVFNDPKRQFKKEFQRVDEQCKNYSLQDSDYKRSTTDGIFHISYIKNNKIYDWGYVPFNSKGIVEDDEKEYMNIGKPCINLDRDNKDYFYGGVDPKTMEGFDNETSLFEYSNVKGVH